MTSLLRTSRPAARTTLPRRRLALAVLASLAAPLSAQPLDDGHTSQLQQVVVTAAGFEQKITDAPASVSVVTRAELAKRPYTSLVDALRDVEGIDVGESTDKNGMASITMRGMPADYTLVLIDGRRQSNVGDLYPNNFGGGQYSFLPPLDSIERIEVVRGPMSTLYGSDAMGGVINIITRKVASQWHGSITQGRTWQQDDQFGNDRTTDLYLNGPIVPGKLGLSMRGSLYKRQASIPEWDPLPLPDGTLWERSLGFGDGGKQVASRNWNGGLRLSFTPSEDHDLWLDYDVSRQKYDNSEGQTGTLDSIASLWRTGNATIPNPDFDPSQPIGPSNPATIVRRVVQPRVGYTEQQRYERDQLAFTHVGRWSFGTSETSITRSTSNNLGRSLPLTIAERAALQDLWNAACVAGGGDPFCSNARIDDLSAEQRAALEAFLPRQRRVLELDGLIVDSKLEMLFGDHQLTVGGQYNDTDMEDGTFGMDGAGFRDGTTQKHKQWAVFAEDNWRLTDSLTATFGVRYDDHNIFGDHFSPRGYLVWTASPNWTLKGGVSTGYKTPKPNQLFPGITGFGGQGVNPFVGSPDLQPETSTNTELAAYYDGGNGFSFNATAFVNKFKDKIATGDSVPNCEVAPPGVRCVDIGPGWAEIGYTTFSQSINIDRAESRGVELAGRVELTSGFTLRGNYTYTDSEQKSGRDEGLPITGNPAKHMLNATLDWQLNEALSLALIGEARSKRFRERSVTTGREHYYEDYRIVHLGASWKATDQLTINGRINNLLDKNFIAQTCELTEQQDAYTCVDDYRIKDKRRSLWLSANLRF